MVAEIKAIVMSSFIDQLVALRDVDILLQCLFVAIYHNLSSSTRHCAAGNPPTIHAVLLLRPPPLSSVIFWHPVQPKYMIHHAISLSWPFFQLNFIFWYFIGQSFWWTVIIYSILLLLAKHMHQFQGISWIDLPGMTPEM